MIEDANTILSVQELADLCEISPQAVRYYHKEGLLEPKSRGENNYRKYGYREYYRLTNICYLRKMRFTIQEIKDYMGDSSAMRRMSQLATHNQSLKEQCTELLRTVETMEKKLAFLESEVPTMVMDAPSIIKAPPRNTVLLNHRSQLHMQEIFLLYPTVVYYKQLEEGAPYEISFSCQVDKIEAKQFFPQYPCYEIPAGTFLSCYHEGAYTTVAAKIDALKAQYPQYTFDSTIYVWNIVDQFIENDENNFVVQIQLRILEP